MTPRIADTCRRLVQPCRVFEAGESDIGHPDQDPVNVTTFSGNVVQPGLLRSTLRIAGIVSSTSAQDVADLLEGVQLPRGLDSITFFGDAAFGNRTAVVEVADENAWQTALSRNQQPPGNAHLQVHPITHAELAALPRGTGQHNSSTQQPASTGPAQLQYMSVRPQSSPPPSFRTDGSTLKLRGLPYTASVSDILTFFEGDDTPSHLCPIIITPTIWCNSACESHQGAVHVSHALSHFSCNAPDNDTFSSHFRMH